LEDAGTEEAFQSLHEAGVIIGKWSMMTNYQWILFYNNGES
jgi:hypothetical protein